MDDRTLLEKLNMLAQAHASGPDDDGHIIAQAVEEIERLRAVIAKMKEDAYDAALEAKERDDGRE